MAGITIRDIGILFGYEVDKASEDKVENSVKGLKDMASKTLGAIGLTLSIAGISSAIKDCVSLASEVEEMENKFDVVFGNLRDDVDAWCQDYADAIGRNKNDIKTYLADQQNLLVGFGMTREAGADLSKQMTTLALDLASFGNIDEGTAVNAMTKAIMGESEAAKTLGAVLNDSTRAQAMQTLGLSGTYEKLDQLTKMQVNYQAILNQSPDAIGDCERSLGSYESTMRQFQAKLKEVKQIIGQFFLPTFQKVLSFGSKGLTLLRDGIQRFSAFADKVGGAERILRILGVTAAAVFGIMNFGKIISGLTSVVKLLTSAKASVLVVAAAALALALIVEDFIAFMQGKNSLIGNILAKTGVDCDALRERIRNAWSTIRNVFKTAASAIKNTVGGLFGAIRQFWEQNGEAITQGVSSAVTSTVGKLEKFSQWLSENWGTVVKVAGAIAKLAAVFLVTKGVTEKVTGTIKKVTDAVGTAKKFIGPAAEAFKGAGGGLKGLGAAFKSLVSPVGIAVIAIAAVAAVLFDLFNFMNGKDSVFGTVLGKLGVDTEAVRSKMIAAWGQIKSFLLAVWGVIQSVATSIFGGLKNFWAKHGDQVKTSFVNIWNIIKGVLSAVWNAIKAVATVVFGALSAFWNTWGSTIMAYFSGVWETIKAVFSTVLDVLVDLFAIFTDLFSGNWSQLWEDVKTLFSDVWNGILTTIGTILQSIWSVITSVFSTIWEGIKTTVTGIKDTIVEGFQSAIDWITSLPEQALQWGADIIQGIVDGITGAVGAVGEAVKGVADKIKSFLGFSEPEDGPLSNFHTYMPDMMNLMAQGIQKGKSVVGNAIKALTDDMSKDVNDVDLDPDTGDGNPKPKPKPKPTPMGSGGGGILGAIGNGLSVIMGGNTDTQGGGIRSMLDTVVGGMGALAKSARPSVSTLNNATNNSSVSKVVNFNSEINQEFHGDAAAQQNISKAADSAAEDTTGALARALAYS